MKIKPSSNRVIRTLKSVTGGALDRFLLLDHLVSSSKSQILRVELPALRAEKSKHLTIYARFADSPHLSKNEWALLNMFTGSGHDAIVVTNSRINESEVQRLVEELKITVITRKNRGRDFGAFRDALLLQGIDERYSSLLLVNNSMLWDCEKLKNILETDLTGMESDIIGLTDSFQRSYHLQSYFLFFHGDKWENFLSAEIFNWKNWHFKRSIVHFGERALSKRAVTSGLKIGAVFSYSKLLESAFQLNYLDHLIQSEVNLNPTQHFWELLIANSFPGIKISLLDSNPARLPKVPNDPRTTSQ
jgi:hypothetical protein